MPKEDETRVYRIERHGDGVLRLYRDDELIDSDVESDGDSREDVESDGDSREDVERWGADVAWADHRAVIERWLSSDDGGDWHTLIAVVAPRRASAARRSN